MSTKVIILPSELPPKIKIFEQLMNSFTEASFEVFIVELRVFTVVCAETMLRTVAAPGRAVNPARTGPFAF